MACPFFEPLEPLVEEGFCPTERVTLGAVYRGRCTRGTVPADSGFRICNRGYARHICPNFPENAEIDAYRFARSSDGLRVVWIEERDHRPVRFSEDAPEPGAGTLALQFAAFQNSVKEGKI
ncbi:MAG: hypothetical protein JST65_19530 [Acidobacteria bacterium]|nr:hypothetical protein [Acidobacteriota bacterium]